MKFQHAFYTISLVLILHAIGIGFDIYNAWKSFDIPMHLAGGFAVGMLGLAVHHAITDKHHLKGTPMLYHFIFVLGFVMLIAVAWEFHEYLIDNSIGSWLDWSPNQPSIEDTMLDLLMGAVGGSVAFILLKKKV